MKLFFLTVIILIIFGSTYSEPVKEGFYLNANFDCSVNPIGMMLETTLFYRWPLFGNKGILFENSRIDTGVMNRLTPTDDLAGIYIRFEPIAFFDIAFEGGYYGIFDGVNIGFRPIDSPKEPYDPDSAKNLAHLERSGMWWMATPTLKMKLWNIIVSDSLTFNYFNLNYPGYYIAIHTDSILRGEDVNYLNNVYGLYQWNKSLLTGVNDYYLFVPNSGYVSHRLSAMAIYKPAIDCFADAYIVAWTGTFLQDHCYEGKLFLMAQIGFTIKL